MTWSLAFSRLSLSLGKFRLVILSWKLSSSWLFLGSFQARGSLKTWKSSKWLTCFLVYKNPKRHFGKWLTCFLLYETLQKHLKNDFDVILVYEASKKDFEKQGDRNLACIRPVRQWNGRWAWLGLARFGTAWLGSAWLRLACGRSLARWGWWWYDDDDDDESQINQQNRKSINRTSNQSIP